MFLSVPAKPATAEPITAFLLLLAKLLGGKAVIVGGTKGVLIAGKVVTSKTVVKATVIAGGTYTLKYLGEKAFECVVFGDCLGNTAREIESQGQKLGFELEKGLCLEKVPEKTNYPVEYFAVYTKDLEKAKSYFGQHCDYPQEIPLPKGSDRRKEVAVAGVIGEENAIALATRLNAENFKEVSFSNQAALILKK